MVTQLYLVLNVEPYYSCSTAVGATVRAYDRIRYGRTLTVVAFVATNVVAVRLYTAVLEIICVCTRTSILSTPSTTSTNRTSSMGVHRCTRVLL